MLLTPEESDVHSTDQKILDRLSINEQGNSYTGKVFGYERHGILVSSASFDQDHRLHGFAELRVPEQDRVHFGFGFDDVVGLKGRFVHGDLTGIVEVELQDFRRAFLTVRQGVAHGPALIAGFVPILPVMLGLLGWQL